MEERSPYIVGTENQVAGGEAPPVMTVDQVAAYLQVSNRSIYNLAAAGEIPAAKVAGQWRFLKTTIDHWLDKEAFENLDIYPEPDFNQLEKRLAELEATVRDMELTAMGL